MRPGSVSDHRVEVNRLSRLVDDRCAGDAQRLDVAAWQGRERDWTAQRAHPDLAGRARIDRVNIIVLGGDDKLARRRSRRPPKERLGIEVARDLRMKARVEMD